jgi:hypothetical protein
LLEHDLVIICGEGACSRSAALQSLILREGMNDVKARNAAHSSGSKLPRHKGLKVFKRQKRKNPLSRVSKKLNVVTLSLNWCPEEDSNFHDLAVTST